LMMCVAKGEHFLSHHTQHISHFTRTTTTCAPAMQTPPPPVRRPCRQEPLSNGTHGLFGNAPHAQHGNHECEWEEVVYVCVCICVCVAGGASSHPQSNQPPPPHTTHANSDKVPADMNVRSASSRVPISVTVASTGIVLQLNRCSCPSGGYVATYPHAHTPHNTHNKSKRFE
jgi:hypothetical protein